MQTVATSSTPRCPAAQSATRDLGRPMWTTNWTQIATLGGSKNQSCLVNEYLFGCPKVLGDRVEHGHWLQDVPLRGEAVQWRRQDATDICSGPVTYSSGAGQTELRRGDIIMNPAGQKRIRN